MPLWITYPRKLSEAVTVTVCVIDTVVVDMVVKEAEEMVLATGAASSELVAGTCIVEVEVCHSVRVSICVTGTKTVVVEGMHDCALTLTDKSK